MKIIKRISSSKISKFTTIILLISLFVFIKKTQSLQWYQQDNPVFLTAQTFDQSIQQNQTHYKFVKFFTPYCRYCRFLKDVIQQIKAKDQMKLRTDILYYQFNCNDYPQICMRLGIRSYPHVTIYGFHGENLDNLHGFHQQDLVQQWMNRAMPKKIQEKKEIKQQQQKTKQIKAQLQNVQDKLKNQSVQKQKQPEKQKQAKKQQTVQQILKKQEPLDNLNNNKKDDQKPKDNEVKEVQKKQQQKKVKLQQKKPQEIIQTESKKQQLANSKQKQKVSDPKIKQQQVKLEKNEETFINQQIQHAKLKQKIQQKIKQKLSQDDLIINKSKQQPQPLQKKNYFKILIYIIAGLVGIYYFSHIMKNKEGQQGRKKHHEHSQQQSDIQIKVKNTSNQINPLNSKKKLINKNPNNKMLEVNQKSLSDHVQIQSESIALNLRDQDL